LADQQNKSYNVDEVDHGTHLDGVHDVDLLKNIKWKI